MLYNGNNAASGTIKSAVRALNGVSDFTQVLKSGDFIVWNRGAGGADATYGHIAVVEIVEKDRIVISNANWPPAWRVLRATDMKVGMYAYPKGTK